MTREDETNVKHNQNQDKNTEIPGLLPPHALPTPPPLPEDISTLTSPWWSEKSTDAITVHSSSTEKATASDSYTLKQTSASESLNNKAASSSTTNNPSSSNKEKKESIVHISLLSFDRSSAKDSIRQPWKERCFLLATTVERNEVSNQNVKKELEGLFDRSKACSMICFMRQSKALTTPTLTKDTSSTSPASPGLTFNPLDGTWLSVAKTPKRCKEHLIDGAGNPIERNFPDYYTIDLGKELSHSGEYVSNTVKKTFSPLQHLSQKYADSWKNGNQQAFFSKFWSSLQKGDAFYLVRDSTKKLIENALGHDKNDKK